MGKPTRTKWLSLIGISLLMVAVMSFYRGFHLLIGIMSVILLQGLLISTCRALITMSEEDSEQRSYIFPLFQSITVILGAITIYLISEGAYIEKIGYLYWLVNLLEKKIAIVQFEIATYIWVSYGLVTMVLFRKQLGNVIGAKIDQWFPPGWIFILAIILVTHTRIGFNYFTKVSSLIIGAIILILMVFIRRTQGKMRQVYYMFKPKEYIATFSIMLTVLWAIGTNMPAVQELPGTRWLKNLRSSFGAQANLEDYLPTTSQLTKDLVISDIVLFEVDTNEPLYLREVAYKTYTNNIWEIDSGESSYESDIDFKPTYLEAEYNQTTSILNEMAWIRSQDPELFSEYQGILNRESSPILRKQYSINQNPINKVNYFTVNGFRNIEDSSASNLYYYGSLENIYFHSDRLIEPALYQVSYYDRSPKQGSKEYTFLKGLSHTRFINLYKEIQTYRKQGFYNQELVPKILRTYTPLIQYQRAQSGYLQVPEEIEKPVYELASKIIVGEVSDLGQSEAICNYLKENYIYNLKSKPALDGDDVCDFLFNQKQGICQDFASSMVLMCRSIGIPARYVTGYLVTEKKSGVSNTYVVREKDAHAFVEVYIPAYGWMLFDPTPPVVREEIVPVKEGALILADYIQLGGGVIIAVLVVCLVGISFKGLQVAYWLLLIRLRPTKWGIESLLRKTLLALEKKGYSKQENETISQYQKRMLQEGMDITLIVKLFEKSTFGQESPTHAELKQAMKTYRSLVKNKKSSKNEVLE